jgi:hypothetical protein
MKPFVSRVGSFLFFIQFVAGFCITDISTRSALDIRILLLLLSSVLSLHRFTSVYRSPLKTSHIQSDENENENEL